MLLSEPQEGSESSESHEMPLSEQVAGARFKVPFKILCLLKCFERYIELEFPGSKLGRVGTVSGVMVGQSLFEIRAMTSIQLLRVVDALKNVSVKHFLACHPPSPRLRRTGP